MKKVVSRIYNRGYIPKEMHQHLVPRYSGPGKLKGNPILYKEKAPLRTIASGLNTATERIAEHESNEFVESSPSFLRETTDFILKMRNIPEPLAENSVLFCFGVQKLSVDSQNRKTRCIQRGLGEKNEVSCKLN